MYFYLFIYFDFGEVLLLEDHILDREVKYNLFLYFIWKILQKISFQFSTNSDILIDFFVKSNI